MCESYGTPSKGLMQVIPVSFRDSHDPLANAKAAVEHARTFGTWTGDWHDGDVTASPVEIRPRQGGKATAIARAEAIAETVKPRPEMAEIMERAASMPSGPAHYASGGMVHYASGDHVHPSPTVGAFMSPGEWVTTPETAREKADEVLRRMTGMGSYTPEERAAMDEGIRAAVAELDPFDGYPEPPTVDPF